MTQDLKPVGILLGELGLIVRPLDDGALVVTADESIPLFDRIRLTAQPDGLHASRRLVDAEQLGGQLARALDALNREVPGGRCLWRDGAVFHETFLPWDQGPATIDQLHSVWKTLAQGANEYLDPLQRIVQGQAEWTELLADAVLPPSYLPGTGQASEEERATRRIGRLRDLPGRSELDSAGAGAPRKSPVLPLLVLVAAVGGVGVFLAASSGDAGSEGEVADAEGAPDETGAKTRAKTETKAGGARDRDDRVSGPTQDPDATPGGDPEPQDPEPQDPGPQDPGPQDPESQDPGPQDPEPQDPESQDASAGGFDAETFLEDLQAEPERRPELLAQWNETGMDRVEGARLQVVEALAGEVWSEGTVAVFLTSLRQSPPSLEESLACLQRLEGEPFEALVVQLGWRGSAGQLSASPTELAEALRPFARRAGGGVTVLETLARLGEIEADEFAALIAARGEEWATFGEGRLFLTALATERPAALRGAFAGPVEVRLAACEALSLLPSASREALQVLTGAGLRDDEPEVRKRAIETCVVLGDARVCWALARMVRDDPDSDVKAAARDAFTRLPRADVGHWLDQLYAQDAANERMAAVLAWRAWRTEEGIVGLIGALDDADRGVRLEGIRALQALHRYPEFGPAIEGGLASIRRLGLVRDDEIRRVARALHVAITGRPPE